MSKDSFVIYKSWASMMAELPDEELAELTRAVMCHQIGEEFTINNPVVKAIFDMFRSQFDKDDEKYEEVCQRRSENGKKGGRPKVEEKAKESKCFSEKANESKSFFEKAKKADNESDSDNDNESDLEKEGAKAPKKEKAPSRFNPPTLDEVKKYCEERHNGIDPQHFIDYYASQRWKKANGRPLADWKAAVRTWESKDKEKARSGTKHTFNTFEQRANDYDDIEAKMMNRRASG